METHDYLGGMRLAMTLNRFQVLKHKMVNEADLSRVWLYWMDNFVDDPGFVNLGDKTRDDFLETVVPQICHQMFNKQERIVKLMLICLPNEGFIHGPVEVGGRIGSVIYFKSNQTGVLAIPNKLTEEANVNYSRFSNPMVGRMPGNPNLN